MTVPDDHPALILDGVRRDLSHLTALSVEVPGKGREPGTDLQVLVKFSNHVFTERTLHGRSHDTRDHRGTKRTFDPDRYNMSLRLPGIIAQGLVDGALCFVSIDFGGHENPVTIALEYGDTWSIAFCFRPLMEGVVMEILSMHPKPTRRMPNRNHLTYFARKCLFQQERVPKTEGSTEAEP